MAQWNYEPCEKCGSSDGFAHKEGDEWGHCFVCGTNQKLVVQNKPKKGSIKPKKGTIVEISLEDIASYDIRGFQERGIRKNISAHFGVRVAYDSEGNIVSHFYPYTKKGVIVGYKERKLPKTFTIHGDAKGTGLELFGQNVAGGGKRIVITEGELDAMAVSQAQFEKYQKFYPVVSVPSASQTSCLLDNREWLRSFGEVILMFDSDEPGKKAIEKAAKIIGYDKVKVAHLPAKDPCEVYLQFGGDKLMNCMFDAQPYNPSGIVRGDTVWDKFKERQQTISLPYPKCLDGLNGKLKGMRMGEIALFTSGTGSGKSTVIKEIILEILNKTTDMVGLASLEESVGDTAEKFIGMQLKKNLSENEVSEEEAYNAYKVIFGDERLTLLDHQGSVSDESLIDKLEHLALIGCKYIVLDHITVAVSEGAEGKTGNEAVDSVMSSLLKLTKKHNIWLGIISHLRKGQERKPFEEGHLPTVDDIKGSGSIKQISFDIIGFARNMVADNDRDRNTIKFRVLKCRHTGLTGDAGAAYYNHDTGRLSKVDFNDFEVT